MEKIDFVLPWVDGGDPRWQQARARYTTEATDNPDALSPARFRDMDTLRYVLRSIETHCPWYNRIVLITEGHIPKWLNTEHPKIAVVTHRDIFHNPSHLPVFNSVAIEMNLVNIPSLSDKFVYMNDDLFIWHPIEPSRFFVNDKPVDFFAHSFIPRSGWLEFFRPRDTWIHSINRTLALLNDAFAPIKMDNRYLFEKSYGWRTVLQNALFKYLFRRLIWLEHWHHPQPYQKKTLEAVFSRFSSEMLESSAHRFRSKEDLNIYLYRYWHLIHQEFHPKRYDDALVDNIDTPAHLDRLIEQLERNKKIRFVCFNDTPRLSETEFKRVKERLIGYLEQHFPQKASFEK